MLEVIRRELRRISPGVKIDTGEIKQVLLHEVLKREVVEGDKADEAKRQISRAAARSLRARTPREGTPVGTEVPQGAQEPRPSAPAAADEP